MYQGPGIYAHYKGKLYFVLGLGMHTETAEEMVIYRPLYDTAYGGLMMRPRKTQGIDSFDDVLKLANGQGSASPVQRFKLVTASS